MDDDDPAHALSREDLEGIRRSLAMANSLPATDAYRLLAEMERLRPNTRGCNGSWSSVASPYGAGRPCR
jgi:hypothetical protein